METTYQYRPTGFAKELDERFYIMADCAPVMLWMAGTDSRCHFFNKPWLDFAGRTLEEEIGEGWIEGVYFEDFQHCVDTYLENFNKRQEFRMEYRLRRHDGIYRWILDTGRPYYDTEGKFAGFIGSCIDITDLKELRLLEIEKARLEVRLEEREKANEKLSEANKDLDSFTYNVSHDLRAPLRAMKSYVELFLENNELTSLDKDVAQLLEKLREKSAQMNKLLDGLIKLSRPFEIPHVKTTIHTRQMVESVISSILESHPNFNAKIETEEMPAIYGDEALVRQLFTNLILNGIKFSQKSPSPLVRIGRKGKKDDEDVFFISDNGVGIAPNDKEKLFQIFRRFHPEFEGTGVGLSIVRKVINRHQGNIWVESEVGQGTTFFFTLGRTNA
jgi:PAS domain S-box-containing protein